MGRVHPSMFLSFTCVFAAEEDEAGEWERKNKETLNSEEILGGEQIEEQKF